MTAQEFKKWLNTMPAGTKTVYFTGSLMFARKFSKDLDRLAEAVWNAAGMRWIPNARPTAEKGSHRPMVLKRRAPGSAHTAAPKRTTGIRVHRHKGLTWARTHIIQHIHGGSKTLAGNTVRMKAKAKRSKHYLHIQSRGKNGYARRTHQSKSKSGAKNTSSFFSTLARAIRYGGAHSRLHSLHKWPVYRDRNQSAGQAPYAPATHADRTD